MISPTIKRYTAGQIGIPGQGPFMIVVLTLHDDHITEAKFQTYGCPAAISCGEFVTTWAAGKAIDEISTLTQADIISNVGQMPLGREHCPSLAVDTLKDAISRLALLDSLQQNTDGDTGQ